MAKYTYIKENDIIDNLTSENINKPLSAKQGKELNDKINSIVLESGTGDMTKSVYDTDNDGIVDRAVADANGNNIEQTYATNSIQPLAIYGGTLTSDFRLEFNTPHGDTGREYYMGSELFSIIKNHIADSRPICFKIYQEGGDGGETITIPLFAVKDIDVTDGQLDYEDRILTFSGVYIVYNCMVDVKIDLNINSDMTSGDCLIGEITIIDGSTSNLVGTKTAGLGEIFNDYSNNQALSLNTATFGGKNISGGKGFKVTAISEATENDDGTTTGIFTLDSVEGIETGMRWSVKLNSAISDGGEILEIVDNTVKVNGYEKMINTLGVQNTIEGAIDSPDTFRMYDYFMIVGHPELGTIDVGFNSLAGGEGSSAQELDTVAMGRNVKTIGSYGTGFGRDNVVGYACLGAGRNNLIRGDFSCGVGMNNKTEAPCSSISGCEGTITRHGMYGFLHGYKSNTVDAWMGVLFGNQCTINRDSVSEENKNQQIPGGFIFGQGNKTTHFRGIALGQNIINHGEGTFAHGTNSTVNVGANYGFLSGVGCQINGVNSTVIGRHLTGNVNQFVIGCANDPDSDSVFIIGNGSWDGATRSNAMTVQRDSGNIWIKGEVTVGSNNEKLATEKVVDEKISNASFAPQYTYSTEDIGVGAELASGTLYIVYEE